MGTGLLLKVTKWPKIDCGNDSTFCDYIQNLGVVHFAETEYNVRELYLNKALNR